MNYQKLAMNTANDRCKNLSNVGLGIASEAGECADIIKKHIHHGLELNQNDLIKEFGDVCWYIALGCEVLGVEFESVLAKNIQKLQERYPEKFAEKLSRKSVIKSPKYGSPRCPICNGVMQKSYHYCPICGQKLGWS